MTFSRISLIAFLICASLSTFAQNTYIGLLAGPNVGYPDFIDRKGGGGNNLHVAVGYNVGAYLERSLIPHLTVQAGLMFATTRYQYIFGEDEVSFGSSIDPRRGFVYESQDDFDNFRNITTHNTLGTWLKLNYLGSGERVRFVAGVGINPEWGIRSRSTSKLYRGDTYLRKFVNEFGDNKFNATAIGSADVQISLSERCHARIEPTLRYSLIEYTDWFVPYKPYSIGLNFSMAIAL